ncbi:murein biosynthesis integral membrane protein MurJ [Candidatus Saccharibacteria bacterium]|nr:murein biosynthesis integral membrane protein MurJ [Candidatus Saccharibacteria bacterium]
MKRMRSVVSKANKRLSIKIAAILLAASTLISSLMGLFRDRLLNSAYLPNEEAGLAGYPVGLDAYTAAFTVPDFMYFILVSGALSVTFIPVFNERLAKGNKKSAWQISTSMINFMALITLIASILIIVFADPIIRYIIAPGLSESGHGLAVSMMRVIAVNPFLFAIATVIASIQQAVGRFTFYALAPIIYNIGIIIGITWFTNGIVLFGWEIFEGGIMGVALGVVLGAILQLLVSSIGLIGLGLDYRFKIYWKNKGFRKVLSLLPPRSLDQGMDYAVTLVEINLASRMADGTIRAYQQALTLHMVPINLIGVAISSAAFPSMTESLGKGRLDLFRNELRKMLRIIIWLALPVAVITFFTRGYLIHFIRNGGDVQMAGILGFLVPAIFFRSVYHITSRAFYAQQDTKTPLYISIAAIALNIVLAIFLSMQLDMGAYGLAIAQSIVAGIEVFILFIIINSRLKKLFDLTFMKAVARMVISAAVMGVGTYALVLLLPLQNTDNSFFSAFPKFLVITAVSFLLYVGVSQLFKLQEAKPIIERIYKLLFSSLNGSRH